MNDMRCMKQIALYTGWENNVSHTQWRSRGGPGGRGRHFVDQNSIFESFFFVIL